ncbi:hypothetical protein HY030_02470 [Candidatus Gottesmanbacteria bacterium]|nr:hypothetical protein [Candidatus Gottesmanbacteria bacterium]
MLNIVLADDFNQSLQNVTNITRVLPDAKYADIGAILSELIKYILPLSGILLLVFAIMGGFDLLTSGGDPKKTEAGKEKLTAAIIGFLIVFSAFWIYQITKYIFEVK